MAEYILELKQLVDYPCCRIYRDFVRNLMNNRDIRVGKRCGRYILFGVFFVILGGGG